MKANHSDDLEEKRILERFELSIPAEIHVLNSGQNRFNDVRRLLTKDICAAGAFFNTSKPLPEGTEVKIDLLLDLKRLRGLKGRKAFIMVKGKVVRSEMDGMAIGFEKGYKISPLH